MVAKTSPDIAQAVGVIMEMSADEKTRYLAEAREKARRNEYARRKFAYQEGRQEGHLDVARRLLLEKDPVEKVAKVTGLSLDEVKSLVRNLPTATDLASQRTLQWIPAFAGMTEPPTTVTPRRPRAILLSALSLFPE